MLLNLLLFSVQFSETHSSMARIVTAVPKPEGRIPAEDTAVQIEKKVSLHQYSPDWNSSFSMRIHVDSTLSVLSPKGWGRDPSKGPFIADFPLIHS